VLTLALAVVEGDGPQNGGLKVQRPAGEKGSAWITG
jgi:hypothetical protein